MQFPSLKQPLYEMHIQVYGEYTKEPNIIPSLPYKRELILIWLEKDRNMCDRIFCARGSGKYLEIKH